MNPIEALLQGYQVVLPNNRSVEYWFAQYAQIQGGPCVLKASSLTSFVGLIQSLWDQYQPKPYVSILGAQQLILLHAYLLKEEFGYLGFTHRQAAIVAKGWQLLERWRVDEQEFKRYSKTNLQRVFLTYYQKSSKWLLDHDVITLEQAVEYLLPFVREKPISTQYYFYGFDDFTPLQAALIESLAQNCSIKIQKIEMTIAPVHVEKREYLSQKEELAAAVEWLRSIPESKKAAIVIPNLLEEFESIKENILRLLHDDLAKVPLVQYPSQVALSSGVPLQTYPMIEQLLDHLRGAHSMCSFWIKIDLFNTAMQQVQGIAMSFSGWHAWLLKSLQEASWCEGFALTSVEYQARLQFLESIESLLALTSVFPLMNLTTWAFWLNQFLTLIVFQPQSNKTDKTVLGLLEAAPLEIPQIWLLGMNQATIPQSLQPHPLLPEILQQQYNMPHAHPTRELEYLKKMFARISLNKNIIISYAKSGYQRHHTPSSLIDVLFPGSYHQEGGLSKKSGKSEYVPSYAVKTSCPSLKSKRLTVAQLNAFWLCPFKGLALSLVGSLKKKTELPYDQAKSGQILHRYLQLSLQQESTSLVLSEFVEHWPQEIKGQEETRLNEYALLAQEHLTPYVTDRLCVEHKLKLAIQGWVIEGRADLWDPVQQVVIDIKSKDFPISSWTQAIPGDFQGPLYTLATGARSLGVLSLYKKEARLAIQDISNLVSSWQILLHDLIDSWDQAKFDPAPRVKSLCHICDFKKACRYEDIT